MGIDDTAGLKMRLECNAGKILKATLFPHKTPVQTALHDFYQIDNSDHGQEYSVRCHGTTY